MTVEEIRDLDRFRTLRPQWAQLFSRLADRIPFLSHEWLEVWWEAFARGPVRMKLIVTWRDGEMEAAAPLVATRRWLWGIPVEAVESAANLHTPRFDFLLPADRDPEPLLGGMLDHLLSGRPRPDLIFLKDLRRDSKTTTLISRLAAPRGLRIGVENERRSPRITIAGEWNDYIQRRSKQFRSNLARYERQWRDLGGVLDIIDDAARAGSVLEEGLALEASGWKGQRGTAILHDPGEAAFYRGLVSRLGGSAGLRQYVLRHEGRAVAWDLCLRHEGVAYGLKKAYDEAYRSRAPGFELQRRELAAMFGDGHVHYWDLLPPEDDVKRRWCDESIEQLSLRVYTGRPRARLAHLLHARARPWLRRVPLLRRAKRRILGE